jgi:mono/diheme cytochrome c family protein
MLCSRGIAVLGALLAMSATGRAADVLRPRVPDAALAAVREVVNPLAPSRENLARGRELFLGKGFCAACHGRDGRGLGADVDTTRLRGALPRNFTDPAWQRSRSDGEIRWVLSHGIPGTAMAAFVPEILSDREAWLLVLWVRELGG